MQYCKQTILRTEFSCLCLKQTQLAKKHFWLTQCFLSKNIEASHLNLKFLSFKSTSSDVNSIQNGLLLELQNKCINTRKLMIILCTWGTISDYLSRMLQSFLVFCFSYLLYGRPLYFWHIFKQRALRKIWGRNSHEKMLEYALLVCGVWVLQIMCCLWIGSLMMEENGIVASGGVAM